MYIYQTLVYLSFPLKYNKIQQQISYSDTIVMQPCSWEDLFLPSSWLLQSVLITT